MCDQINIFHKKNNKNQGLENFYEYGVEEFLLFSPVSWVHLSVDGKIKFLNGQRLDAQVSR